MAKAWSAFLPYVLEDTIECPRTLAENAIRDAVIEFCERSFLWYLRSLPSDLIAGNPLYAFQVPADTKFVRINKLELYGDPTGLTQRTEIIGMSYDEFARAYPDWNTATGPTPIAYWGREPGLVTFYPIPTSTVVGGLFAEIAISPTRSATLCPDFIFENYAETIGHGAKAKLMASVNKPWSNFQMSQVYEGKFRSGISTAESRTRKAKTTTTMAVQPRTFGGV